MVYRDIMLTIEHDLEAEDLNLLSEMRISLTVQKWTEFASLPNVPSLLSANQFLSNITEISFILLLLIICSIFFRFG